MRTFKRYTLEDYIQYLKSFVSKVRFSEVHVHHTWQPDIGDFLRDSGLKLVQGIWRYHTGIRGFQDIAQHVTIDPDGYIWEGRPLTEPPASATGYNDSDADCIHPFMFEMIGNFDIGHDKLEGPQLETVVGLVRVILELWKLPESAIRFHREMSTKTCPGSGIEKEWFLQQVRAVEQQPEEETEEDLPKIQRTVRGRLNGRPVSDGYLIDGKTYVPLRELAEALGAVINWDPAKFEYELKGGK